jgi:hypothetical protein
VQKLKEIKQNPGESVRRYDKRFKYVLSQVPYEIDKRLLDPRFRSRTN